MKKRKNAMKILIENKTEVNRAVLIIMIGILESVKSKGMTVDESGHALFSPYNHSVLRKLKVDKQVLKLVEEGFFIEDYESIFPDKLDDYIQTMKEKAINLLLKFPPMDFDAKDMRNSWLYNDRDSFGEDGEE